LRKVIIAGNWKMNKTSAEAESLVKELKEDLSGVSDVDIVVIPPVVSLLKVRDIISGTNILLGAQNMHWEEKGAFTGEISGPMLKEIGVNYIIIGHSERRQYFGETDQIVNRKVQAAFSYKLNPIICVGENLKEREKGETENRIKTQIKSALAGLNIDEISDLVIAYEPIWAIGTGKSASPEEANHVIKYIRNLIADISANAAREIRIQYGGSVKTSNIRALMSQSDIDGVLVGGASLDAESFAGIVKYK
jgi:triosephosphate isomerase (TIM)